MKSFLLKILIIIIPLIILLFITELVERRNDKSHTFFQKKYITENQNDIEGIIFGPSHMWRSLLPKNLDHNVASLARPGSAINIDYYLFNYVNKLITPKFYVFDLSLGYLNTTKGNEYMNSNKLQYYFPSQKDRKLKDNFLIRLPLKKYFFSKEEKIKYDKWGSETSIPKEINFFKNLNFNDSLLFNTTRSKRLFKKHNKIINNHNYNKNVVLLKKIIEDCREKKIKLIFLSPPKYYMYNKNLNYELALQRDVFVKEFIDNETVFFFNLENFNSKNPKLFFDLNHLNIDGAKLLSTEFKKKLKKIL